MIKAYSRGHEIYFDGSIWRYCDNDKPIDDEERPCKRCGKMPTAEGYDACLGYIEGATSACCGHGVEKPYCVKEAGTDLNTLEAENNQKFYYKIINDTTNELECYASVDLNIKPEKLCEVLNLKGYHAEASTKEEFEANT